MINNPAPTDTRYAFHTSIDGLVGPELRVGLAEFYMMTNKIVLSVNGEKIGSTKFESHDASMEPYQDACKILLGRWLAGADDHRRMTLERAKSLIKGLGIRPIYLYSDHSVRGGSRDYFALLKYAAAVHYLNGASDAR